MATSVALWDDMLQGEELAHLEVEAARDARTARPEALSANSASYQSARPS